MRFSLCFHGGKSCVYYRLGRWYVDEWATLPSPMGPNATPWPPMELTLTPPFEPTQGHSPDDLSTTRALRGPPNHSRPWDDLLDSSEISKSCQRMKVEVWGWGSVMTKNKWCGFTALGLMERNNEWGSWAGVLTLQCMFGGFGAIWVRMGAVIFGQGSSSDF